MRGGNDPTDRAMLDRAILDRAEEDASMSEPVSEPVSDTEVTINNSDTTISPSLTEKAKTTATKALDSVKNLGRSFRNWLGFGGKSSKNHRKSRKNRRKSRKNRKH